MELLYYIMPRIKIKAQIIMVAFSISKQKWYNETMTIRENVPISELTTMRIGGQARYVCEISSRDDITEAWNFAREHNLPAWFMGGGANTIGKDGGFPGVILLNKLRGIEILTETDGELQLRAMGGEEWDNVVEFACKKDYSGIEAMSKIPGTAGAAPVQNIGAYGQDIARVLVSVEVFDIKTEQFATIPRSDLKMDYRYTTFNHGDDAGRYFIVSITLRLNKNYLEPPFYNSLQNYIIEHGETDYSPQNIRRMVSIIRADKLPDPAEIASSGSFFKNIYLDQVGADEAEEKGIPVWRSNDDSGKINSGWLIEHAGLKGKKLHGMKISDKAALVLINEDAKSYADLAAARKEIVDTVRDKFGYTIEQEPVEIPEK